jgi:hypothetical protein
MSNCFYIDKNADYFYEECIITLEGDSSDEEEEEYREDRMEQMISRHGY